MQVNITVCQNLFQLQKIGIKIDHREKVKNTMTLSSCKKDVTTKGNTVSDSEM